MTKPTAAPDSQAAQNDPQDQWDLSPLLAEPTEAAIAADRAATQAATEAFVTAWQDRQDYLTNPAILREALDQYEAWQAGLATDGKSGIYFWLREQQNQADPAVQAGMQQATDFSNRLVNQVQFFELRLSQIATKDQQAMLAAPELEPYRHFLEQLFAAASHLLSEPEERIMNLKTDAAYAKWVQLTSKALSIEEREVELADGTKQPQNLEQLASLISDEHKPVRDAAAVALNNILAGAVPLAEAEINAILANKKVDDELRGYTRPDAARHLSDDIDYAAVDQLLEAVSARNNLAHRYYQLKAAMLGVPQLAYHERNVEVAQADQAYTWPEAVKVVDEVYSQLNPKFGQIFRTLLDARQIDVYPRPGKRGGAFCVCFTKSTPTYLMLNYTGRLRDVTTLAHELGHGLNDEYMRSQNALNFGTPLSTAEVASQYLEDFVFDRLAAGATPQVQLSLNMTRLGDAVSSIFRQVACYRFEQSLHTAFRKQGFLPAAAIGKLFQDAMAAYMGPAVEQSPGSQNWWIYWSHIRTFFYVYSYASGLLIAKAMQAATRRDRAFLNQVETFLAAGRSASPTQIFSQMDIDITSRQFWDDGLDEIERLLTDTEALARQLGAVPKP
jgi:oligoendopeptidase F